MNEVLRRKMGIASMAYSASCQQPLFPAIGPEKRGSHSPSTSLTECNLLVTAASHIKIKWSIVTASLEQLFEKHSWT